MKPIKIGDIVDVEYNDGTSMVDAYVSYVPENSGDMWRFEYNRRLIYQNPLSSNLDAIIKRKDQEKK